MNNAPLPGTQAKHHCSNCGKSVFVVIADSSEYCEECGEPTGFIRTGKQQQERPIAWDNPLAGFTGKSGEVPPKPTPDEAVDVKQECRFCKGEGCIGPICCPHCSGEGTEQQDEPLRCPWCDNEVTLTTTIDGEYYWLCDFDPDNCCAASGPLCDTEQQAIDSLLTF